MYEIFQNNRDFFGFLESFLEYKRIFINGVRGICGVICPSGEIRANKVNNDELTKTWFKKTSRSSEYKNNENF